MMFVRARSIVALDDREDWLQEQASCHEAAHWVAWQCEHQCIADFSKCSWLSWLHVESSEENCTFEFYIGFDQVQFAHGNSTTGHNDVTFKLFDCMLHLAVNSGS